MMTKTLMNSILQFAINMTLGVPWATKLFLENN